MKRTFEAISSALDGTENNMVFFLSSKISREKISNFDGLPEDIAETAVYFNTGGYSFDIEFDKEFDVLFLLSKPEEYVKIKSVFMNARANPKEELDFLPAGLNCLSLIDFPGGIPDSIDLLEEFGSIGGKRAGEKIYLTTQSVMDKILENL
jgi:hypothetical protein